MYKPTKMSKDKVDMLATCNINQDICIHISITYWYKRRCSEWKQSYLLESSFDGHVTRCQKTCALKMVTIETLNQQVSQALPKQTQFQQRQINTDKMIQCTKRQKCQRTK